jgi:hypothetical protein
MKHGIGVAVAGQALVMLNPHAPQDQRPADGETVRVVPYSDSLHAR